MRTHIFDVDHTLISGSTGGWFVRAALRSGLISFRQVAKFPFQWLLYKLAIISPDFMNTEFRSFQGILKEDLDELSRASFRDRGSGMVFTGALDLIDSLRASGSRLVIASSSPLFLVKPLADHLGIEEVVATQLEFVHGLSTGNVVGNAVFGEHKRTAVAALFAERGETLNDAVFYSDSFYDVPLLEACGEAVVVNPDARLRRIAALRGWRRLRFRETVRRRGLASDRS